MGLFDAEDPDQTKALPAPGDRLPRRNPAGAADRTATRFGSGPAADRTAVTPAAPAAATEIIEDDLVARAKRRMEFLGRNPAAESTQNFPMPAFTDETPIVDPPKSTPGTDLVRYDPGRAEVRDREPDLTATTALDRPGPGSITDTGTGTGTALALREPAIPSASAVAAEAAAALAEQVRAAKIQRARLRRRVSIIAALTIVAIVGGVTTGYFAVNWFRDTNTPTVRSDPEHDPNGNQPPVRTVAPDPTETDQSDGAGAPTPSNSSASRSPSPKRSSAPASPRPTGTASTSPKPSNTPSPTESVPPSPTEDAP